MLLGTFIELARACSYECLISLADALPILRMAYLLVPLPMILSKVPKVRYGAVYAHYFRHLPPQGSAAWKAARGGRISQPLVANGEELRWIQLTPGSEEWVDLYVLTLEQVAEVTARMPRSLTVGGSEIQKFISGNGWEAILHDKAAGTDSFFGNEFTRWGNLFEPVIKLWIQCCLGDTVWEYGSLPGARLPDGRTYQTYSPDGMVVCHRDRLRGFLVRYTRPGLLEYDPSSRWERVRTLLGSEEHICILLEFKCPSVKVLTGEIPGEYVTQPQAGLLTMPGVDMSLFVNNAFRACSIPQFGFDNETCRMWDVVKNQSMHWRDNWEHAEVVVAGFIGFHEPDHPRPVPAVPTPTTARALQTVERKALVAELAATIRHMLACRDPPVHGDIQICSLDDPDADEALYYLHDLLGRESADGRTYRERMVDELHLQELDMAEDLLVALGRPHTRERIWRWMEAPARYAAPEVGVDYGLLDLVGLRSLLGSYDTCRTNGGNACVPYYSPGYYAQRTPSDGVGLFEPGPGMRVDWTITEESARAADWLDRGLREYVGWCGRNGRRSKGVMPWKLMRIDVIPVDQRLTRDEIEAGVRGKVERANSWPKGIPVRVCASPAIAVQLDADMMLALGVPVGEIPEPQPEPQPEPRRLRAAAPGAVHADAIYADAVSDVVPESFAELDDLTMAQEGLEHISLE
jgi:hypothetical protein